MTRLDRMRLISKLSKATFDDIRRRLSDRDNTPDSICREHNPNAIGIDAMITLTTTIINISKGEGVVTIGNPSDECLKKYKIWFP